MDQVNSIEKKWNPNIQALRGLSITLVMISHFLGKPTQFGAFGVGIFFCISGYLITGILISEFRETGRISIPTFYQRRAKRLLPLCYIVIIFVMTIVLLGSLFPNFMTQISRTDDHGDLRHYFLSAIFSLFYVGNLFGLAGLGYTDLAGGLAHFWTLAVEEQFYFMWPILLLVILKKWSRHLSAICVVGIFVTPMSHLIFSLYDKTSWTLPTSYLDLFFFGALFTIHQEKIRKFGRSKLLIVAGVVVSLCLIAIGIQQEDFSSQGYVLFTIAEILIFVGFLNWKPFGEVKILRKLGNLSYSLYCIHWPIIVLFSNIEINSFIKKLITILLTFILAIISTKYIETIFWKPRYLESKKKSQ